MTTRTKIAAFILSAVVAASAGAALAISANASSAVAAAQTASAADVDHGSAFIGQKLTFNKMNDSKGNAVNPYDIFGSSLKYAHEMYINEDGTFEIFLGAYKENKLCGTYSYNNVSERFALSYADGFRSLAPVGFKADGGYVVKVPISRGGDIFVVDFSL